MTFRDGTTSLGAATVSNGVASLVTALAAGTHSITAIYNGDPSHTPSTSPALSQTVSYPQLTVLTSGLPAGQAGSSYGPVSMSASGGSGSFRWTASGLPAGLSMSSGGAISGTPTVGFTGSVFISVTDTISNSTVGQQFALTISSTLTITGAANLGSVVAGRAVSGSFTASGGTPPFTWAISGAPGFNVDSTGRVTGTTGAPGNFTATLSLSDSTGQSTSLGLTYSAFGITTSSLPPGTTAGAYNATITAAGGTAPYTFTITGLSAGLSTAGGTITGQPTAPGTSSISVQASDGGGLSVTTSYTLTVTGATPLSIVTSTLPNGTAGQPYSHILAASGGSPAYTWALSGGALPSGLSLSSSGTVAGQTAAPGSYNIGVQVTDTTGAHAVGSVSLTIQPAPLTITNGSQLPSGMANVDYPGQILSVDGGVAPYTFSLKTGSLPAGMTLSNGQIQGTPTASGNFNFTVGVADSATPPGTGSLGMSVVIRPNSADLLLSSAGVSFSLAAGTSATPAASTVNVTSSVSGQILNFTTSASAPWPSVTGGSSTPGALSIELTNAALTMATAGSPYTGTVTVTCTSNACAGNSQTTTVILTITAVPPQLSVGSQLISFSSTASSPSTQATTLSIQNAGGGTLALTSVGAADPWISLGSFPSTIAPGPGTAVAVSVDPSGLRAGFYTSSIQVTSSAGSTSIPVTLLISAKSTMALGRAGAQFSLPQGGAPGVSSGSFLVNISSDTPVAYAASILPGASWLTGGASGSAGGTAQGTVTYSLNTAVLKTLPTGAYYGTIRVAGEGIVNTPLDYQVVVAIFPASTPIVPVPAPAGLIFLSSRAGAQPAQTVQVSASSSTPLTFQVSSVSDGAWLTTTPATGSVVAGTPTSLNVAADSTGLKPGVYRGTVNIASGSSVQSVNVTLVVEQPLAASSPTTVTSRALRPAAGALCAGGTLVATQTGLVSNFSAPAAWPTPLAITLVDSCGSLIGDGQIVATFSNGDPPLVLSPVDPAKGAYSGTWTPRKSAAQTVINARATASGYAAATVQITGKVTPNNAPVLAPNGAFDVFHPQVGAGLGPGNIVQIYGSGLASQPTSANTLPLPTTVAGTQVLIGGVESPLFYVSPGQVNAQIPFELQAGQQYQVIVSANGALTAPQAIQLNAGTPAILQFTSGVVVAQHQDASLVSSDAPAVAGEYLTLYMSGLGETSPFVPTGQPAPANPPATVVNMPTLTLNGTNAPVAFAGLTPGLVGLYQINMQVPAGLPGGNYELAVAQSSVVSNTTVLPVNGAN